jgi:signal transduction histidine kinase
MDGIYHNFNSRFLEIWNLTPEAMASLNESEILDFCMSQTMELDRNIERMKEISDDPDRECMDVLEFKDGKVVERYSRPQKLGDKTVGKVFSFHDITERRRIEKSILESREQLRSLTSQLSLAEERERRRIADQLHDRVGQSLLASKIKLGAARESAPPTALEGPLDEVYRLIEQTIRDVRTLTFELSPPILYMLGFEAAVEWLAEQAEKQYGVNCEFEDDGENKPLDDDIRVLLFQNVRELLVNVCKHSKANNAKVRVSREDRVIRVSVEDDGVGFDSSGVENHWDESSGFGLFSIRERLSRFGGVFEIDSILGSGTHITLTAPLKNDDTGAEGEKL